MARSGTEVAGKVKGWVGYLLTLIPVLAIVPSPVQPFLAQANEFLLALFGVGGATMVASSPKIIGKDE